MYQGSKLDMCKNKVLRRVGGVDLAGICKLGKVEEKCHCGQGMELPAQGGPTCTAG